MGKIYSKRQLDQISYPLGGFGAGMICLEGTGSIGKVSVRHAPDYYNEPNMFAAVTIKGEENLSRVLEGMVPIPKFYGANTRGKYGAGNGMMYKNYGLPRFHNCSFTAQFPFARINLSDEALPFSVEIEGFSPFIPGNADDSSLPAASLKYSFYNQEDKDLDMVFYYSAMQFMGIVGGEKCCFVKPIHNGFLLQQENFNEFPHNAGSFSVSTDCDAYVNTDFYRGGWFDSFTMRWNTIAAGSVSDTAAKDLHSPGGAVEIPFTLKAHSHYTINIRFCWYVPESNLSCGKLLEGQRESFYRPWYAAKYASIQEVTEDFALRFDTLYDETKKFSDTLYATDLSAVFGNIPDADKLSDLIVDAVTANLTILKSTTVLRQTDGRLWAWEGSEDIHGSCYGTCSHVWNYAQALCHLFPSLERTLRDTEFHEDMDERGHQQFRTNLPIRENSHDFHAASDGQPGGIMKMYREWRISGDTKWLASYWDKIVLSMEYCIQNWDKQEEGVFREPHHNTYDVEFWGADGMCTSFYLGALKAISEMGKALGQDVSHYESLYSKGRKYMETILWNGEYFIQIPEWTTLEAQFQTYEDPVLKVEGPKYQYASGCLSDGICGAWLAKECGLGDILDPEKIKKHLLAVHRYNFRQNLSNHANPQRPGYALGDEGGLLLCSWPKGGKPSLPFIYSDEVWTGIEYQVAAHLMSFGFYQEAFEIISALRARYDGERRNPYDEYEWGHWYARALSSYALLGSASGVHYDAVTRSLYAGTGNYTVFLATATGYGLVISRDGEVQVQVISGNIEIEEIVSDRKDE